LIPVDSRSIAGGGAHAGHSSAGSRSPIRVITDNDAPKCRRSASIDAALDGTMHLMTPRDTVA
jgi:hypothetical protein